MSSRPTPPSPSGQGELEREIGLAVSDALEQRRKEWLDHDVIRAGIVGAVVDAVLAVLRERGGQEDGLTSERNISAGARGLYRHSGGLGSGPDAPLWRTMARAVLEAVEADRAMRKDDDGSSS